MITFLIIIAACTLVGLLMALIVVYKLFRQEKEWFTKVSDRVNGKPFEYYKVIVRH